MIANKKTPPNPIGKPAVGPAASGPDPAFPKKELDKWLKAHKTWSHDDWLKLLGDLKAKGCGNLAGEKAGKSQLDCTSRLTAPNKNGSVSQGFFY